MPTNRDDAAPAHTTHEEARGEVTLLLDLDSERGIRATCAIRSNGLTICKTQGDKAVLAHVPLSELQVTLWPHRQELFGLASGCNTDDDIVCCADSEDIRNEWLAAFQRLGIDVATKLGADDEEYVDSWLAGIEINGDALKARLAHKLRRLEEQQARARRAEHRAVPALLCDSADEKGADEKGLKRRVVVEASVQGGTHLEIRREGVLCARVAFDAMRTSCISRDRVFGFAPHEDPKLGLLLHFEDGASFFDFLDQLPAELANQRPSPACIPQPSASGRAQTLRVPEPGTESQSDRAASARRRRQDVEFKVPPG
jgi:hypothetical protein